MDKELNIHDLIVKMRQLKVLMKDDSIVSFELRDKLQNLKRSHINLDSHTKKNTDDKIDRNSKKR